MAARLNYATLSPSANHALLAFEKAVVGLGFEKKIVDLVKMRVSQINGCVFCVDMHAKEARLHEERELRLYHLAVWRESPLFSAREKAALEWAELLTSLTPKGIVEDEYQKALEQFSEKELSDLTFVIVSINAWNRFGVAFQPEPGSLDQVAGLSRLGLS